MSDSLVHSSPLKQSRLDHYLRTRIVDGELAPGQRVPTCSELAGQFNISTYTVQRVFAQLEREGFIRTRRRSGTFVSDRPPHLHHYAIVFPHQPFLSRQYVALGEAVRQLVGNQHNITSFFDEPLSTDNPDTWHELEQLVHANRVAGVLFLNHPSPFIGSPILEKPGLPRVALMSRPQFAGVPAVFYDFEAFFGRAMDELAARGRRRLAVVGVDYTDSQVLELARRRGLSLPAWAMQRVDALRPGGAVNLMQLLMREGPERPDALILADDNIVEHATVGLVAAGLRVGVDVEVVAHCNYPTMPTAHVPVQWLGFDAVRTLQACFQTIDMQRRGEQAPQMQWIVPLEGRESGAIAE